MTFISILFALLIEQLKPLRADNPIYMQIQNLAMRIEGSFNAGKIKHGRLGWWIMVALLMVPTALIHWLCLRLSPFAAFAWNVIIVYLTLGFRRYSHYFTSIQLALSSGDEDAARRYLAEWTHSDTSELSVTEISRLAIERALIATHRNVFGVFFWFLMPVGPACAVMYRIAEYLARAWTEPEHMKNEEFGIYATKVFYWIDWVPARLTAAAFAVVGNFEDAVYSWRNYAERWHDELVGIILSAGGGALGVRLGEPEEKALLLQADASAVDMDSLELESQPGAEASPRALQSAVGLVWRALLLWMLLLLLLSFAVWI
ncbi:MULTISPECIES: CobD/CbiB family protein [unclassified Undibacterium]|uniref:CobD/CbiB family protein n=1 Tax=unclassified Undibacterium TaxID=2630295 RepID=UPI002AC8DD92|nr:MULTISPECIES: CobD/CbiB family protein [unclassified Undibacterium]MEB0139797.1 CobD/CbiB family protein [Undibacterium sp. CCC2.1]MEB0170495.1 CobD/CbiB family protein [Undibacterium sp. CCC1.1]MEB0174436.1 CobD/CbiB family protein [Undibacterium sp. CCC3.4]MEB0213767.1 CobD/CbiB family protein [Undibacterium sp. 5I2]WPX43930.1 CobD/CbiB family protein [Undibacterium sp. CCC3.4]